MIFTPPDGIYWPAHRIATSGRYHDSLHTIMTEWGLPDVRAANELLDVLEDLQSPRKR